MNVTEAVNARKTVRAFLPKPVPEQTIRQILTDAARAPSGGNLQPWKTYVMAGKARDELLERVRSQWDAGTYGEGTEYEIYPKDLREPYVARRREVGFKLYELAGIARDDKVGRMTQMFKNYELFGAPVCMIFTIDRQMGLGQWADLGMYIQTVMLLAMDHGLVTCPQEAWANWHKTLTEILSIPDEEMVFCGVALGYEDTDAAVNTLRAPRAGLEDVKFFGFETT